ncbi:hypothetical protein Bca52824_072618 [Brassica carinata]|uniref:cellulase n=1 Tax=Brassica carinata TaxID=52824 RepID=A0A8X7QDS7_BRACI|nr:hypothetical protein Bca52824_072618 [Brassica carinata]
MGKLLVIMLVCIFMAFQSLEALDYGDALNKSILFFEGQRSGKLPVNQRVLWRADSALSDGQPDNVNLIGGFYDAGDNVKFVWPMSFTTTLLSWTAIEYQNEISSANQLGYLRSSIKWATDFILRAHTSPTTLYTQVGDGNSDHSYSERPEDMDTPRTLYKINSSSPGSEAAGEAAAALASAALVFKTVDSNYSSKLLSHAKSVSILLELVFDKMVLDHISLEALDYGDALNKSILFFEGQRSGKLPVNQRVLWRADSALSDGQPDNVNLIGGFYDAGDNVKFVWPMSFTTTLLSWTAIEYQNEISSANQLGYLRSSIKWATDFILRAHTSPTTLYTQVGDGNSDHSYSERPEDMDTPRTLYKINSSSPGSEAAGEAAAALASAALVFKTVDSNYSSKLLSHAKSVNLIGGFYDAGDNVKFVWPMSFTTTLLSWTAIEYQNEISSANQLGYLRSSIKWATDFILRAHTSPTTLYTQVGDGNSDHSCSERPEDMDTPRTLYKINSSSPGSEAAGEAAAALASAALVFKTVDSNYSSKLLSHAKSVSILLELVFDKMVLDHISEFYNGKNDLGELKNDVEPFVCALMPGSSSQQIEPTPGGLLFTRDSSNLQYVTTAITVLFHYSKILTQAQVDYILGNNPMKMSYMVGYGNKYPTQPYHRGSSLPSIKSKPEKINCNGGISY